MEQAQLNPGAAGILVGVDEDVVQTKLRSYRRLGRDADWLAAHFARVFKHSDMGEPLATFLRQGAAVPMLDALVLGRQGTWRAGARLAIFAVAHPDTDQRHIRTLRELANELDKQLRSSSNLSLGANMMRFDCQYTSPGELAELLETIKRALSAGTNDVLGLPIPRTKELQIALSDRLG